MHSSKTVQELKRFEWYRDTIWPIHRLIAKRILSKRCKLCILSEAYVKLHDGICDICLHQREKAPGEMLLENTRPLRFELNHLIEETLKKDRDRAYDALVLFSGGKDSSYMIWRLKKDFPRIKILALTIDNTFMSEVALYNVKRIVERLGVEHIIYRPERRLMERIFSYAFTHLNEKGCAGTVDQFDGDFFCDVARNFCVRKKIPLMFVGLSKEQVEGIMGITHFLSPERIECQNRTTVAKIPLSEFLTETEIKKYFWQGSNHLQQRRPKVIYPFYAWRLSEDDIKEFAIQQNLIERGLESPLLTNSQLIPLMGLVDHAKLGYSSFEPEFAKMIRDKRAKRRTWLHTFEIIEYSYRTKRFIPKIVDLALLRLGLTKKKLGIE